jgi:hypothetical protein
MVFVGGQDAVSQQDDSQSEVPCTRGVGSPPVGAPGTAEPGEGRRSTRVRSIGRDAVASRHRLLIHPITYRSDLLTRGIYYMSA